MTKMRKTSRLSGWQWLVVGLHMITPSNRFKRGKTIPSMFVTTCYNIQHSRDDRKQTRQKAVELDQYRVQHIVAPDFQLHEFVRSQHKQTRF